MTLIEADYEELDLKLNKAALDLREPDDAPEFIRASSIYDCMRKRGYHLLGIPKSNSVFNMDWDLSAKIGDTIHYETQLQLAQAGLVIEYPGYSVPEYLRKGLAASYPLGDIPPFALEIPLSVCCDPLLRRSLSENNISGHIDAIIRLDDGSLCIFDIKTVKPSYLDPNDTYGKATLSAKKKKWKSQISTYLHYFSMPDGEPATKALILVISRGDTKDRVLFEVPYESNLVAVELGRAKLATEAINRGELPEPEVKRGPCFFCEWRNRCEVERGAFYKVQEEDIL